MTCFLSKQGWVKGDFVQGRVERGQRFKTENRSALKKYFHHWKLSANSQILLKTVHQSRQAGDLSWQIRRRFDQQQFWFAGNLTVVVLTCRQVTFPDRSAAVLTCHNRSTKDSCCGSLDLLWHVLAATNLNFHNRFQLQQTLPSWQIRQVTCFTNPSLSSPYKLTGKLRVLFQIFQNFWLQLAVLLSHLFVFYFMWQRRKQRIEIERGRQWLVKITTSLY